MVNGETGSLERPRQEAVFRLYLRLESIAAASFSGTLGGRLLLCIGGGRESEEAAIAASLAGGASLAVDSDPDRLKAGMRDAAYDFVVNTLDESLRILKNELRKKTPVSVGLLGETLEILSEMTEQGVQPDLIAEASNWLNSGSEAHRESLRQLVERGAEFLVSADEETGSSEASHIAWNAQTTGDLRRMDQIVLKMLPAEDRVRRQWLERAGGYLGGHGKQERIFAAEHGERLRLIEILQEARSSGAIASEVSVSWQEPGSGWKTVTF